VLKRINKLKVPVYFFSHVQCIPQHVYESIFWETVFVLPGALHKDFARENHHLVAHFGKHLAGQLDRTNKNRAVLSCVKQNKNISRTLKLTSNGLESRALGP